eukprot:12139690-Alexandrium_andersonii.AAC.1
MCIRDSLDPVPRRQPILHPQGVLPDAREVGLDEDFELILHREDAVHGRVDRHELLLHAMHGLLEVGVGTTGVVQQRGR